MANHEPREPAEQEQGTERAENQGSEREPAVELPEVPERAQVEAAVNAIVPELRTCGENLDLVSLELNFAPNGRATSVVVDARHLSPTQRSCLARAARAARVPPFGAPRLTVRYPVRL